MYQISLYCEPRIIPTEENMCYITIDRDVADYIDNNDIKLSVDFDTGRIYDVPFLIKEHRRRQKTYGHHNINVDCTSEQYEELLKLSEEIKPAEPVKFKFHTDNRDLGEVYAEDNLFYALKRYVPEVLDKDGRTVSLQAAEEKMMLLNTKNFIEEEFFVIVQKRYERQLLKLKLA